MIRLKKFKIDCKTKSEPWWKRRIKDSIKELNRNINQKKSNREVEKVYEKFRIRREGLGTILEEHKQRTWAKVPKIERYNERIKQFKQN